MNVIFSDSRGRDMQKQLPNTHTNISHIYTYPGATLGYLTKQAIQFLHHNSTDNIHIYFIGGLCDIASKEKDIHYQEVVYMETPKQTTLRLTHILQDTETQIKEAGATPCFATIAPQSLHLWNNTRLTQGKTSHLLHYKHYDHMQTLMNTAITNINRHIIMLNHANNMHTPKIGETIIKPKSSNNKPRLHYTRLQPDGVHLTPNLATTWNKITTHTIDINRTTTPPTLPALNTPTSEDSDTDEDRDMERGRPWLPARE
jgi:hypothetical protein